MVLGAVLGAASLPVVAQTDPQDRPGLEQEDQATEDRPWLEQEDRVTEDRPWLEQPDSVEGRPRLEGVAPRAPAGPAASGVRWGWHGSVLFGFDSAGLQAEYEPLLSSLYQTLQARPEVSLLLTGRADNVGDIEYNRRLAQRRAEAVADYFIGHGIAPERIVTRTVGEQRPVASDRTAEDRARNRRVDLAFFPAGTEPPAPGELVSPETAPGQPPPKGASYRRYRENAP